MLHRYARPHHVVVEDAVFVFFHEDWLDEVVHLMAVVDEPL